MGAAEILLSSSLVLGVLLPWTAAFNVSYDGRALRIDGEPRLLISGSIHYPRSTPDMWPDLISKAKDGGLDVIDTYVFWNVHEPVRGFPLWLQFIDGIKFRTDNEPFKAEMQRFTAKIVDKMKAEKLFASQGGPIILSQNEYGNVQRFYGPAAKRYIKWAATMATSLKTGVPWVMCQQADAPSTIINTCNGFYCDQFTPNSRSKPKMWTETWSGWFQFFGSSLPQRPAEDLAFAVARFSQNGGSFQNYYMYHGGTNFGRTAGGPFVTTSYDYDAPIDEYGLLRQPKWGHLKDLHHAIKLCKSAMVATSPTTASLGPNLEATVYETESGHCSAFLANFGTRSDKTVKFRGVSYILPAWSVSILPDCKKVTYNTAKINSQAVITRFKHQLVNDYVDHSKNSPSIRHTSNEPVNYSMAIGSRFMHQSLDEHADLSKRDQSVWSAFSEPVGISTNEPFTRNGLLEQINTTADKSDHLWYSLSININGDEPFLRDGKETVLHVVSLGHVLHTFVNGKYVGSRTGSGGNAKVTLDTTISLKPGRKNVIDLLSATVGLQNYGAFFDLKGAGITGPVFFKNSENNSTFNLSSSQWVYQVGLKGEVLGLSDGSSPAWKSAHTLVTGQPLIWYKKNFNPPAGTSPVALNFSGMRKGEAWVNGQSIGRYWPAIISPSSDCRPCNYRGPYNSGKCRTNCGLSSQALYHVPRGWFKSHDNILVVFEEIGGDPRKISFATREVQSLCSHVSESHPQPVDMWKVGKNLGPVLSLECPSHNQVISCIKFASFGNPNGACGSFRHGQCSSSNALSIVQEVCTGQRSCTIKVSDNTFGEKFGDSCVGIMKSLAVEASCT